VIADVDEVLRQLLIREVEIKDNEIDIAFDLPKREWSSRLSKPTINLFLFDIRQNLRLRAAEQYRTILRDDGMAEVRRNPVRLDLRYLMTAWVKEPEDEHMLLGSAMSGLLRNPNVPDDIVSENLKDQQVPVQLDVAHFSPEEGPVDKFSELWGVLDNEMRAGIVITVTIMVDPYKPAIFPQVRTSERRFVQNTGRPDQKNQKDNQGYTATQASIPTHSPSKTYWSVAGSVKSEHYDISTLSMVLVEKNYPIELADGGKFFIQGVGEGEYHLDILYNKKVLKRQAIKVPSPDYVILV
jgi:hypothetical protein